ncbi:MAG: right-handed parallel beta-helix repeat-containing protein [Candidatus Binatia bacterium]
MGEGFKRSKPAASALSILLWAGGVAADVHYIGEFAGSVPADDAACGAGKLSAPDPHPCATLAHFNRTRWASVAPGDSVRVAPGRYRAAAGDSRHCVLVSREVTWEGRSEGDEALGDPDRVVIELSAAGGGGPCFSRGATCLSTRGCDASGFTIRDLTLIGGERQGVKLDVPAGSITTGFTLERVRISGFGEQGINLGNQPSDIDCRTTGRRIRDVRIRSVIVEGNHGVFGGIALNCIDGYVVEDSVIRDNLPAGCDWEACRSGTCDCDDHDGLQLVGAINGLVRGNEISRCGEDCLDIGGHWRKTYNLTVESNRISDGAVRWVKMSGGTHDIAVHNNFFTGAGTFELATCQYNVDVHNNTLRRSDAGVVVKLWTKCQTCEFVNNIIVGRTAEGRDRIVMASNAATDPSVRWLANVIDDESGTGLAIREETGRGNCGNCTCGGDCAPPIWCPDPWPSARHNPRIGIGELDRFRREGDEGGWFGAESGDRDVWGRLPRFVEDTASDPAGLHLRPDDDVAQDAGMDLSGAGRCLEGRCTKGRPGLACSEHADCSFNVDFDGELRVAPWDIGADEQVITGPFPASPR